MRSIVLIISGPAGVGKTTLCERLLEAYAGQVERIVTTTTRAPRPGERDGVDYHFLARAEFEKRIQEGAFIEWAQVHDNLYGSQRAHLADRLQAKKDLLLNIDVQGAASFRAEAEKDPYLAERLVTVFLQPASIDVLRARMSGRGTTDPAEVAQRLASAEKELARAAEFDHRITSSTKDADWHALEQIYLAAKKA